MAITCTARATDKSFRACPDEDSQLMSLMMAEIGIVPVCWLYDAGYRGCAHQSLAVGAAPGAEERGWCGKNSDSGCGLSQCPGAQNSTRVERSSQQNQRLPNQEDPRPLNMSPVTSNPLPLDGNTGRAQIPDLSSERQSTEAGPTMSRGRALPRRLLLS